MLARNPDRVLYRDTVERLVPRPDFALFEQQLLRFRVTILGENGS
jgi:hypothetical protein